METEGENEVAPCNKKQVRGRWGKGYSMWGEEVRKTM